MALPNWLRRRLAICHHFSQPMGHPSHRCRRLLPFCWKCTCGRLGRFVQVVKDVSYTRWCWLTSTWSLVIFAVCQLQVSNSPSRLHVEENKWKCFPIKILFNPNDEIENLLNFKGVFGGTSSVASSIGCTFSFKAISPSILINAISLANGGRLNLMWKINFLVWYSVPPFPRSFVPTKTSILPALWLEIKKKCYFLSEKNTLRKFLTQQCSVLQLEPIFRTKLRIRNNVFCWLAMNIGKGLHPLLHLFRQRFCLMNFLVVDKL